MSNKYYVRVDLNIDGYKFEEILRVIDNFDDSLKDSLELLRETNANLCSKNPNLAVIKSLIDKIMIKIFNHDFEYLNNIYISNYEISTLKKLKEMLVSDHQVLDLLEKKRREEKNRRY